MKLSFTYHIRLKRKKQNFVKSEDPLCSMLIRLIDLGPFESTNEHEPPEERVI